MTPETSMPFEDSAAQTGARPFTLHRRSLLAACAALAAWPGLARAEAWPTRPIRMVVPFPPGGGFDAVARPFAERLQAQLKQNLVVDNRAGAGGNIGTAEVARAANDGYTILFANEILATNPNVYKTVPFDPLKDFEPVAMVATTPLALAIYPGLPAKNLAELIALSAREPITFGTPGIGTSPHLFGELLNLKTPLKLRHIPYRGTGPAINDAMGGQVNAVLTTAPSLTQQILSGKLRGIAMLGDRRSAQLPDLPTLAEGGIKGLSHEVWYALMAPAGTPQAIVGQLREASMAVLRDPDLAERLRKIGIEPVIGDGHAVTLMIRADLKRWADVVADARFPKE
jgi:tripartite-type tricarboxylate transporter receptor subunit TctC